MNFPSISPRGPLSVALLGLCLAPAVYAQDATPPVVVNPIADVTVAKNSAPTKLNFKNTFGLKGVTGTLVEMTTNLGDIDVELFDTVAPKTASNFLDYVDAGSYKDAIFHRSTTVATDGLAIIQAGETTLVGDSYSVITTFGNVDNEYSLPNTPGTIAMAKEANSPDSASDQFYFNISDNSKTLGKSNDGGFTVFGHAIEGTFQTVEAIGALKTYNLETVKYDWSSIPLYSYDPSKSAAPDNLVVASSIAALPLVSKGAGYPGAIKVQVKSNTNPGLVDAVLQGHRLILIYVPNKTGTAEITLQAKDRQKTKVTQTFKVTVQ